jgi:hypothetical protein
MKLAVNEWIPVFTVKMRLSLDTKKAAKRGF